jgi:hypothetical protein
LAIIKVLHADGAAMMFPGFKRHSYSPHFQRVSHHISGYASTGIQSHHSIIGCSHCHPQIPMVLTRIVDLQKPPSVGVQFYCALGRPVERLHLGRGPILLCPGSAPRFLPADQEPCGPTEHGEPGLYRARKHCSNGSLGNQGMCL